MTCTSPSSTWRKPLIGLLLAGTALAAVAPASQASTVSSARPASVSASVSSYAVAEAAIRAAWQNNSSIGPATSGVYLMKGGYAQEFSGKHMIYWSPQYGAQVMTYGDILIRYWKMGGPSSSLGMPRGPKVKIGANYYQAFRNGVLVWSGGYGAKILTNDHFEGWYKNLSSGFPWGDPMTDRTWETRGANVKFTNQTVIWDAIKDEHFSAEVLKWNTVLTIGDSQLDLNSWVEQGAARNGYTDLTGQRAVGGWSYGKGAKGYYPSGQALAEDQMLLPAGNPPLIVVTLGGNDATVGTPEWKIRQGVRATITELRSKYPYSKLVVNGVMSRSAASSVDHSARRWVDQVVTSEARAMGVSTVSVAGWGTVYGGDQYRDGVHLAQGGHDSITPVYAKALAGALGR